jgi:hypothetical protein
VITVADDDTVKSSFVVVLKDTDQPLSKSPLPENVTSLSAPIVLVVKPLPVVYVRFAEPLTDNSPALAVT